MTDLKLMMEKAQAYDDLVPKVKGYGYDSLCFRYIIARDAQMRAEIIQDKKETSGCGEEHIRSLAERDKIRFFQILDELIGQHD